MARLTLFLHRLGKDNSGQTLVEYGLLAALLVIAVIIVLLLLGPKLSEVFTTILDNLRTQP